MPRSAAQQQTTLDVMTYNIHADTLGSRIMDGLHVWKQRRERVVRLIAGSGCDVIGLQECVARQWDYLTYALADRYDTYGVGSDGGLKGEIAPLFWRRERFDLLASDTFWINDDYEPHARMPEAKRPRICSWIRLRDKAGGAEFTVYNLHFDHRGGSLGDEIRSRSADLVLRRVAAQGLAHSIVFGDLNCQPGSKTCGLLARQLVDAYDAVSNLKVCMRPPTLHLWGDHGLLHLDFIYCTRDVQVEDYEIVCSKGDGAADSVSDNWPSDHFPVRARLRL